MRDKAWPTSDYNGLLSWSKRSRDWVPGWASRALNLRLIYPEGFRYYTRPTRMALTIRLILR